MYSMQSLSKMLRGQKGLTPPGTETETEEGSSYARAHAKGPALCDFAEIGVCDQ